MTTCLDALRRSDAVNDELVAIAAPYDDAPDKHIVLPTGLIGDELLATWLSAREDVYVALVEMRQLSP